MAILGWEESTWVKSRTPPTLSDTLRAQWSLRKTVRRVALADRRLQRMSSRSRGDLGQLRDGSGRLRPVEVPAPIRRLRRPRLDRGRRKPKTINQHTHAQNCASSN